MKVLDGDRINEYSATLSPQGGTLVQERTTVTVAPTDSYGLGPVCSPQQQTRTDLDIPGPGRPTPAEAVAPYADGLAGWWPDSYIECGTGTP